MKKAFEAEYEKGFIDGAHATGVQAEELAIEALTDEYRDPCPYCKRYILMPLTAILFALILSLAGIIMLVWAYKVL